MRGGSGEEYASRLLKKPSSGPEVPALTSRTDDEPASLGLPSGYKKKSFGQKNIPVDTLWILKFQDHPQVNCHTGNVQQAKVGA